MKFYNQMHLEKLQQNFQKLFNGGFNNDSGACAIQRINFARS